MILSIWRQTNQKKRNLAIKILLLILLFWIQKWLPLTHNLIATHLLRNTNLEQHFLT